MKRTLISALTFFSIVAPVGVATAASTAAVNQPAQMTSQETVDWTQFTVPTSKPNTVSAVGLSSSTASDPCMVHWNNLLTGSIPKSHKDFIGIDPDFWGVGAVADFERRRVRLPDTEVYLLNNQSELQPSSSRGNLLHNWHTFDRSGGSDINVDGNIYKNRDLFEEALSGDSTGIDGYCFNSYGAYIDTTIWERQYFDNKEPEWEDNMDNRYDAPFCGSPTSIVCNDEAFFTGLDDPQSQIFIPRSPTAHVNAAYMLWAHNLNGAVSSDDSNAIRMVGSEDKGRFTQTCEYPFSTSGGRQESCPHDFLTDNANGDCNISTDENDWFGCVVLFGGTPEVPQPARDLCPSEAVGYLVQPHDYHNEVASDAIYFTEEPADVRAKIEGTPADGAPKYTYTVVQTDDGPEDRWYLNRQGCTVSYTEKLEHRNEYEYRKLSWYNCSDVNRDEYPDFAAFIDEVCGNTVSASIAVECEDFKPAQATLSANVPPRSQGDYILEDVPGVWDNDLNQRADLELETVTELAPNLIVDGSVTLENAQGYGNAGDPETVESERTPTCDGEIEIRVDECLSPGVATVEFTARTFSSHPVEYAFGIHGDTDLYESGTVEEGSPVVKEYDVAVPSTLAAEVGIVDASFAIAAETCTPDVALECQFLGYTATPITYDVRVLTHQPLNSDPVPVDVGIYRIDKDGVRHFVEEKTVSDMWAYSDEAESPSKIEVRYFENFTADGLLADLPLSLEDCASTASVHLYCPDNAIFDDKGVITDDAVFTLAARVDNTSPSGKKLYYRLFVDDRLARDADGNVFAGVVTKSVAIPDTTFANAKAATLKVYGIGDSSSSTEPSAYTEVIAVKNLAFPCGAVSADIVDKLCKKEDPGNHAIVSLTSLRGTTQFTVTAHLDNGTIFGSQVIPVGPETANGSSFSSTLRDLFPGLPYERVFEVQVDYADPTGTVTLTDREPIRHDEDPSCEPPICDKDGDGIPDPDCDPDLEEDPDVLAEIIHDSWEYGTVRDIQANPNVAWTHCRNSSEVCDLRIANPGKFPGQTVEFRAVEINEVMIDLGQQEQVLLDYPGLTAGIDIDMCDLTSGESNLDPYQRIAACEVLHLKAAETDSLLGAAEAIDGTYSHWKFHNATIAEEIEVDGEPTTAALCWDVSATVYFLVNGTYMSKVSAGVIHNAHSEIGMPDGRPFWQPKNNPNHSEGCFAVWGYVTEDN